MKNALVWLLKKPAHWSFYLGIIGAAVLANILELGWITAAIARGVIVGGIVLVLLGIARRFVVGHWG